MAASWFVGKTQDVTDHNSGVSPCPSPTPFTKGKRKKEKKPTKFQLSIHACRKSTSPSSHKNEVSVEKMCLHLTEYQYQTNPVQCLQHNNSNTPVHTPVCSKMDCFLNKSYYQKNVKIIGYLDKKLQLLDIILV